VSATQPLQAPKGTRDFYPEEMRLQNYLFDAWRKACLDFGFEEYEGPTFEHLELFTEKSGREIVTQLYNFKDKGDRDLALRPEMTPTLARMVNQKGNSLKLPLRWFSVPRLFRYEKAQRGRLREFFQLNMDILGCEGVAAEVELLSAIIEMLKGLGLKGSDFAVHISSRKLLSDFLDSEGIAADKKPTVYAALDKRAKLGESEFRVLLQKEGLEIKSIDAIETFFQCKDLASVLTAISDNGTNASNDSNGLVASNGSNGYQELAKLFQFMTDIGYGDFIKLDLSVVRGLAYYTGIVFEVYDREKSLRAIAGGGRYDNLLANLGGHSMTGVGFGMGDVVLYEFLKDKNLLPSGRTGLDYYLLDVAPGEDKMPNVNLIQLAQGLRAKGKRVGYSLSGEKFKKQIGQANDQGAKRVLFFGSDKAAAGSFEIKDMTTGEQKILVTEEL